MGIYLNPGNRMFQRALNAQFYMDKSALISFMNRRLGTDSGYVAVSRPRRFGKSVDANMLVAYYSRGCDSRAQFAGLEVARDASFEEHLNAHDVIRVDAQRLIGRGGGIANIVETFEEEVLEDLEGSWPGLMPRRRSLFGILERIYDAKGSGFVFEIPPSRGRSRRGGRNRTSCLAPRQCWPLYRPCVVRAPTSVPGDVLRWPRPERPRHVC